MSCWHPYTHAVSYHIVLTLVFNHCMQTMYLLSNLVTCTYMLNQTIISSHRTLSLIFTIDCKIHEFWAVLITKREHLQCALASSSQYMIYFITNQCSSNSLYSTSPPAACVLTGIGSQIIKPMHDSDSVCTIVFT